MQFTRPDPEDAFRTVVSVSADVDLAVHLLAALESSEWSRHVLAISEVPHLSVEVVLDLQRASLEETVRADLLLDHWVSEQVEGFLSARSSSGRE